MFESEPSSPITDRELRWFAVMQCPFLTLLLLYWNGWSLPHWASGVSAASAVVAATGAIFPKWMRVPYGLWMGVVGPIGWLVSHLVLAIVYYAVVTPIGWGLRRWAGDPLTRHLDRDATSYWESRPTNQPPSNYFRRF